MFPELRGESKGGNRARGYGLLEQMKNFGPTGIAELTTWLAVNGTYLHRFESFAAAGALGIIVTVILRNLGTDGTRKNSTEGGRVSFRVPD